MIASALLSLLLLAPPPDVSTWREAALPGTGVVVATPSELKSVAAGAEAGVSQRKQWETQSGPLRIRIAYLKRSSPAPLTARQYLEAYGKAWVQRNRTSRMTLSERTVLGKPAVELRITDPAKTGIHVRSLLLRDASVEWLWETTYTSDPEKEAAAERFFDSIRPAPAVPVPPVPSVPIRPAPALSQLPELQPQRPGPGLSLSLPGQLQAEKQSLTAARKKIARNMAIYTLNLPDRSSFYLVHTEYKKGAEVDQLKNDFLGLLNAALAKSEKKIVPKVQRFALPNALGYQAHSRTRIGADDFTYRIASFSTGAHGWGILMMAPSTPTHEKLLDEAFKSIATAKP